MKKVWLLENEQARWFEFEEPHDMPDDVTVTMLTETEQPAEQEPFAWMTHIPSTGFSLPLFHKTKASALNWQTNPKPLYESPPQRKPLTDEEICRIGAQVHGFLLCNEGQWGIEMARAIEAAHGIKENT